MSSPSPEEIQNIHYFRIQKDGREYFSAAYISGTTAVSQTTLTQMVGSDAQRLSDDNCEIHVDSNEDSDLGTVVLRIVIQKNRAPIQVGCYIDAWDDPDRKLEYMSESVLALRVMCYDIFPVPSKKSELHPVLLDPTL